MTTSFSSAFSSSDSTSQYGSFHMNSMFVRTAYDFVEVSKDFLSRGHDASASAERQAEEAIRRFTPLHEFRHFHDCFGTLSGVYLFLNFLEVLDTFYDCCLHLRDDRIRWNLPLRQWTSSSNCPSYIKDFARIFDAYEHLTAVFMGDFRPTLHAKENLNSDVFSDIIVPPHDLKLATFHLHARSVYAATKPFLCAYFPIGFRSLIEGNAHALLRDLTSDLPKVARDAVDARFNTIKTTSEASGFALDSFLDLAVYNVADQAITKYLDTSPEINAAREQFGLPRNFPRSLLYKITDYALNCSEFRYHKGSFSFTSPGEVFQKIVESIDLSRGNYDIPEPSNYDSQWRSMVQAWKQSPQLSSVDGDEISANPADVMRAFAIHEIVIPIAEARIETGHAVFWNSEVYRRFLPILPKVPFHSNAGGQLRVQPYVPELVQRKHGQVIWLASIMEQIGRNRTHIVCPKVKGTYAELSDQNFSHVGNCLEHIARGCCSNWQPFGLQTLPQCEFALANTLVFGGKPWEETLPAL